MKQRIQTLDGLRFLAAMGVLWIHCWIAFRTPRCYVGKVDIADFMALGANGVDLFFVISGFCMYYFYGTKSDFSYHSFLRFIKKRWIRLSPAFYAATLIYIIVGRYFEGYAFSLPFNFLHSVFYLNYFFGQYNTARHFWTLTVEWQFYFTIPFLLIYQNKLGFKKSFILIFGAVAFTALIVIFMLKEHSDMFTYTALFRMSEFACGVVAARALVKTEFRFRRRIFWLMAFILITYTGRTLISASVLRLSLDYHNVFKLIGYTVMGIGFAGILYLAVTSAKGLDTLLGNKLFRTMGRISYSFYLFHVLIYPFVVLFVKHHMAFLNGLAAPVISMLISALILYPVSMLSYTFLEKPFLSMGNLNTK